MEFYIRRVEISPRSLPKVGHKANPTLFHPQFTNRVTRGIWSLASSFTSLPLSLSLPPILSLPPLSLSIPLGDANRSETFCSDELYESILLAFAGRIFVSNLTSPRGDYFSPARARLLFH